MFPIKKKKSAKQVAAIKAKAKAKKKLPPKPAGVAAKIGETMMGAY